MSLFAELKRRKVFRVAASYAVIGRMVIEVSATIAPQLDFPEWVPRLIAFEILLGFPVAMVALGLGDHDRVFVELERAKEVREPMLPFIGYGPFWDLARGDKRLRELLRQLNLNEFYPADADSTPGFC